MALIIKSRVLESSTTTGTGAFTLAGAVTGYRTFASVCSTNDTFYYCIEAIDANGNPSGDWETGLGTYSGANTLTRTSVHESTNSNNAVNFAAGSKRVSINATATHLSALQPLDTDLTDLAAISGVQGDIICRNGTQWTRLAAGTAGQKLITGGAGANPSWQGHRGAMVYKSTNQTAANYTTITAITFDAEARDTDSIHDTGSNPSRLSVPSGVSKVKLKGHVRIQSHTANRYIALYITKNGSTGYIGEQGSIQQSELTVGEVHVESPVLDVTGGTDYFELALEVGTDTSIDLVAQRTWFEMEIIE